MHFWWMVGEKRQLAIAPKCSAENRAGVAQTIVGLCG